MTSEQEALLANVAANPDDDLARLVYADWLEERGGEAETARAKFIRLQIARAQAGLTVQPSLKERVYLRRYGKLWQPKWTAETHATIEYDRGFPHHIHADTSSRDYAFVFDESNHIESELRTLKSLSVKSSTITTRQVQLLDALSNWPLRSHITSLIADVNMSRNELLWQYEMLPNVNQIAFEEGAHNAIDMMAGRINGQNIRCIRMDLGFPTDTLWALLTGTSVPNLVDLGLSVGNHPENDLFSPHVANITCRLNRLHIDLPRLQVNDLIGSLLTDESARNLSELSVSGEMPSYPELTHFIESHAAKRLKLLSLVRDDYDPWRNEEDESHSDHFAARLMASHMFGTLEHLELIGHPFCDNTRRELIVAATAAGIKRLAVRIPHKQFMPSAEVFDQFDLFGLEAIKSSFGQPSNEKDLADRLGSRASIDMTSNYFAAQRRWNPL